LEYNSLQLKEILVPVDGSRASLDALALACVLAKRNKGRVHVVYVIEVARRLPLDAELSPEAKRGEEILREARQIADSQDSDVADDLLQARDAGHAIVDEAIERAVDGIILGTNYRRPLGEYQMGAAAQYVLKNAPCPVIVYRAPVGGSTP
jgi:nucleotide-binding universal stress UspA family protein